jgi:RHS repeat-associated protein
MNGPTTYHYTYDGINRLVKGDAGVNIQAFSPGFSNQADFGDESLIYDKIGNISSLTRGEIINGNLLQNVYSYSYFSATNRLQTVTNTAFGNRNITYDNNGNMLTDNKLQITGSTIGRANLTTSVTTASANIKYSYASDDNRIYKSVTQTVSATNQKEWYLRTGGGVDIGIFNISNNQFNWYVFGAERVAKVNHIPTLTFTTAAGDIGGNIYTSDPFIIPLTVGSNMPAPIADYYVYDHLGNTRVIFGVQLSCSNGTPTYLLRYAADYYPYGKVLREWTATTQEKYLYTQHERDKETGLDYAGARFYDSGLGRFTGVDPLAHMREWLSTYNYCQNNPINLIDPTGALDDDYLIRNNGEVVVKKTDDKFDRFYTESGQKTNGNMTIRTYSLAAQLDKNEDGLVKFPDNGTGFTSYGSVETGGFSTGVKKGIAFKENVGNGDSYLTPQAAAALFGVIHELSGLGITISLGDMSSSNGSDPANGGAGTFHHAGHGHMGKRSGLDIDFRYIGDDGNSFRGVMSDNRFNLNKNKAVYNAAFRFGFDPKNTYQGTTGSIQGVKTMGGHNNHGHLGLKRNPSNFINYKPYMP